MFQKQLIVNYTFIVTIIIQISNYYCLLRTILIKIITQPTVTTVIRFLSPMLMWKLFYIFDYRVINLLSEDSL